MRLMPISQDRDMPARTGLKATGVHLPVLMNLHDRVTKTLHHEQARTRVANCP
jgi:hypothetical protein